ncbi:hypothetical protein F53441_6551 [Fusarium austroafricanum]|uniref:C2H2-type domain-containing protein n=1 Tax=Fusarium austroafricanum TaxID=2364996 RepID=A0A8H4NT67_9HYPO|nr:hypothetical protein F53441_6551 [Fusarium austroafricanum]
MLLEKPLCSTCGISFSSCEECRQHSKTDAHIVKTDLHPFSVDLDRGPGTTFNLPFRPNNESKECREPAKSSCDDFSETKSVPTSEAQGEEGPEVHPEVCLFCCHISPSFDENTAHMTRYHGFIILRMYMLRKTTPHYWERAVTYA